ncbi:MAG: NAD(+)/NADH kinase [Nevskia sp.]|nr:NAD(+)/NADH kinase [Nevskia sp.]
MGQFSTIGIVGKRADARAAETLRAVAAYLRDKVASGRLSAVLAPVENAPDLAGLPVEFVPLAEIGRRSQLAIVVGGDGTLLSVGRALAPFGVPLLGVNRGRLGFMVDVRPEDMVETLDVLLRGEALIEERLLLEARVHRAGAGELPMLFAVNDVVLRNQASIRMLEFETWLDSEFISRHRADGLIISTPTGSTAYALSGGGPVLHPSLAAVTLVPICPHTLSDRPIVVPADRSIRVVLRGDVSGAAVTCDGQVSATLAPDDSVEILPSPHRMKLVHPRNYSYFQLLRDKLHWGRSPGGTEGSPDAIPERPG